MQGFDNNEWSTVEETVAKTAFERAYQREINALVKDVKERASTLSELNDLWRLHDFLSARRHEIDGKYDYRYPMLLFVFANLVKEGWLHLDELEGLHQDKITKIGALARM